MRTPVIMILPVLGLLCAPPALAAEAPARANERSLEARVAKLERLLQSQGLVDLLDQVDALQTELQRLRGDIEFQTHTLEQIKKRQRELYLDLDRRIQRLEAAPSADTMAGGTAAIPPVAPGPADNPPLQVMEPLQAAQPAAQQAGTTLQRESASPATTTQAAPPVPAPAAPAPASPATAPAAGGGPAAASPAVATAAAEAAYKKAFALLKDGHYEQAIAAFQSYLKDFPGSSHADNAQYWLGEANYVQRQFEPAIAEYSKLIQNYPRSHKLSHAQLKIAYSYQELGQIQKAREILEKLRQDYPGTTAARLAAERLQDLAEKP